MLIRGSSWRLHRPWAIFAVAAAVGASVWFFAEAALRATPSGAGDIAGAATWPGGSSRPGLTFGVLGGLIILFEALLWLKKKVRAWRLGRAQVWLRAHIWLGLLCVPLLIYHSGFRLGGPLSTVLMVLLLVVVASGIWGLALQQFLPTRMLEEVPAETIYSQIEHVTGQLRKEAERLVLAVCGPPEGSAAGANGADVTDGPDHLVVGAVRSAGRVQGKVLETRAPAAPVPASEPLRHFFDRAIEPYLVQGTASGSPLQSPIRSAGMFRDLRTQLDPAAHGAVDVLEGLCDQRRQFDAQARIQFWLHNWLWVHLPLSAALVVLMFVHVWVALKYW